MVGVCYLRTMFNVHGGRFDAALLAGRWYRNVSDCDLAAHEVVRTDCGRRFRDSPSWDSALGMVTLGFLSATMGLQVRLRYAIPHDDQT